MSLKEFAIETFDIAEWNVIRSIMRLKTADFEYQITPKINPIRWILGHLTWHMDYIFNYLCQGEYRLKQEIQEYFATGTEVLEKRDFPLSIKDLINAFLEVSKTSFEYLYSLPDEKFNELPENNDRSNTETVNELLQRISLHFLTTR